ncbi:hypothetical protein NCLIV_021030 [Neospora caninum Liverpool]|uniref:YT521-B family protein n=1 Tax=Neospora caninum (strain Liverpool) TaxID=572307 RepID=F0VF22_NEOCL|nr:hypothetical protein NCLIV_021030 [Neospora caninum Liverpool]CBZ52316.1 hypothetical protein NCLIV_021030 [Neospora caninum Liverpool]CEL66284.1 TPA: YT521-B family protein [Neospora caninum Liverpool]|eukprot:XP_003882348.1 hypothetical protein NCLIV_021030 [Neospora caninum Liverpool]
MARTSFAPCHAGRKNGGFGALYSQEERPAIRLPSYTSGPPTSYAQTIYEEDNVRFFILRSRIAYNIEVAMQYNMWATRPHNDAILGAALKSCKYVVLLFSVNNTHYFCGWAIMRSLPGHCRFKSDLFKAAEDPRGMSQSRFEGNTFEIEWIRRMPLDFKECEGLLNSLNQNLPVYRARDGQEVAPAVGRAVCSLFETQWQKQAPNAVSPQLSAPVPSPSSVSAGGVGSPTEGAAPASPKQREPESDNPLSPRAGNGEPENQAAHGPRGESPPMHEGGGGEQAVDAWGPRILNPAIQIYPVDLTSLTYDGYIRAYQASRAYWRRRTEAARSEEERREDAKERERKKTRLVAAQSLHQTHEANAEEEAKQTEADDQGGETTGGERRDFRVKEEQEDRAEAESGLRGDHTEREDTGQDRRLNAEASVEPGEPAASAPETPAETGAKEADVSAEDLPGEDTPSITCIKREREKTPPNSEKT